MLTARLLLVLAGFAVALSCAPANETRPNFLVILADDLGYSDLGFFGSEIATPNLDALAAEGVVLTNYHVMPTCAPTRAALLTGMDPHPVGMGSQGASSDPNQAGQRGYEGVMTQRVVSVASLLRDAGYHTSTAGKWHLGADEELMPHNRGFVRSFGVAAGGIGHFGDAAPMFDGYPNTYRLDGEPVPIPEDFYSTDYYTDRLIEFLDESAAQDRPFFMFAAYTSPHWPLQAPDEYIDRYRGVYDDGYDALRRRRVQHLIEQRVVLDVETPDLVHWMPAWDTLTEDEKRVEARKMEVYSAMVENLDHNIGRLVAHLKEMDRYDNTFIIFSSDNGAEGNDIGGLAGQEWIAANHDLSYENMGRMGSYVWRGPAWAQAQTAPFNLFKAFTAEGGIRTPAVIRYRNYEARRSDVFASVMDVVPTVLALAGVDHPDEYNGRPVEPIQGTSMTSFLSGQVAAIHAEGEVVGYELYGRRAVFKDGWKLVWTYEPYGLERWQLFDLNSDPAESTDLSVDQPERLAEMMSAWEDYVEENDIVLPVRDRGYGRIDVPRPR